MDTNDIASLWAKDSPIDETNLVGESKRIPELHSKYYNLYYREVLRVKKLKADYGLAPSVVRAAASAIHKRNKEELEEKNQAVLELVHLFD